ncbi:flagellar basal body P-ring protein [Rubripirellula lacrimiformis]|uniref:Flagellar basal body P-ring protein n=1 Tax=Rubripirellula lacrimiformis TaxID=1930273 RepID=A0A517NHD5_9BACT|nr:flagellar basal body P-ring protein FlgI [Rubripirellula lacrimiformis]QDT06547.1 flagellar basal body P-ring protein [Rubripirellula lacrimiformis]
MPKHCNISRFLLTMLTLVAIGSSGCSLWRGESDEDDNSALKELMKAPAPPDLVREAAISHGLHAIKIDGVGAVNSLAGTGGPADPSLYRDQLLEDMKRREISDPNHFLESNDTALVRVQASIPPGARRGDPLDIRVLAPPESRATNLAGGWLLDTRLRQQIAVQKQLMQSSVRQSEVLAIGTGPVLTRGAYTPTEDSNVQVEGSVISGGRVQTSRQLALILRPKFRHVAMSSAISSAVNRRFFFFDGTTRRGIATPREDDLIEIEVHPRYRDSIGRMMEVVRAIGIEPESSATQKRLTNLAARLANPATAADAAIQLEAMGDSAVPTLLDGLNTQNPELKFYAAEALAYLDRTESLDPLEASARDVAAFRAPALLAMQGLKQQLAIDSLQRLMNEQSLETRYGAFCSIRRRSDGKRVLDGQALRSFWMYQIPSDASPAVVVSLRESPEIVLFGDLSPVSISRFLRGPGGILVRADDESPQKLRVSRFQVGKEDQLAVVDATVSSLITGIAAVGGGYGDTIEILRVAKEKGYMLDQLAIDPLPKSLRTYYRDEHSHISDEDSDDEESSEDSEDDVITDAA